jgi:hypothetical protein
MPEANHVVLEIYDVAGRQVEERDLGVQPAGMRSTDFAAGDLPGGVYLYRLRLADPVSGIERTSLSGKLVLLR